MRSGRTTTRVRNAGHVQNDLCKTASVVIHVTAQAPGYCLSEGLEMPDTVLSLGVKMGPVLKQLTDQQPRKCSVAERCLPPEESGGPA